jgi:DNA primase
LSTHQGKRSSPSFSAHLERGIWQCFGCKASGNVLDFACRMEGLNPDVPQELRKAALKIRDLFLNTSGPPARNVKPVASPNTEHRNSGKPLVNTPLDFELMELDPDHPYLLQRGFTPQTIQYFRLGFCNRGLMKGRIAIPLHDVNGQLVGYAGRMTQDDEISASNPKYRFPSSRERKETMLEFKKSLLLYHAHHIAGPVDNIFVVEGFPACWWLWQADYQNVVALMGADCSDAQAEIIVDLVKPDGKVWAMPDGNAAGIRCAKSILEKVSPHRFVRWVRLQEDEQPTDVPADELMALFDG